MLIGHKHPGAWAFSFQEATHASNKDRGIT